MSWSEPILSRLEGKEAWGTGALKETTGDKQLKDYNHVHWQLILKIVFAEANSTALLKGNS